MHATPAMLPVRLVCMQQANFAPAMHAGMQLLRGLDEKACMGSTKPPPDLFEKWHLKEFCCTVAISTFHLILMTDKFDENWTVKQANLISVWEERHTRWAEDLSPLQESDFEFNTEYYSWYLENGKPFLVSVEAGNKWREDPRCSKHRQLTSEFGQSFEEPTDDPYDEPNFDRSRGWPSSWDSVEEQPSFGNVMEFGGRATIIW
ncbi:hypothetical protein V6N11_060289 [Hibiscus sabdariffa]|uniref:Uncharacterized protein n=1 Tax=Hibiscus sabdariffa TaxID=183260 RepID=A0ABR2QQF9_9ROSI